MGLSTFDGDRHFLAQETKVAMAGVDTLSSTNPSNNPLPDELPSPVNSTVQSTGISPAPKAVSSPPTPVTQAPPQPPQNIYSGGPSSLPSPTRSFPNMETKMSKLRDLLDKTAMTEEDLYGSYSEPSGQYDLPEYAYAAPAMQARAGMENYTPEPNYSDYMAYVPEYSRDPKELQVQDIYDDYSPEQSLGYDPYQAYANYEQMYASPGEAQGEVQDIQVPEVSPEVQEYEAQLKVYEDSYNQILTYLMQMGYSAEEAQAAAPALLGQVSVQAPTAPEGYGQPKTASQARLIGAGVGGLGGALGGHSAYDEEGEFRGALAGGALGALLGGLAPGMRSRYSGDALLRAVRSGSRTSESLNKTREALLNANNFDAAARANFNAFVGPSFTAVARAEALANRSADAQKLLAGVVPGYIVHRALANSGGDNLADKSFDLLSDAGDLAYLAGQKGVDLINDNKGALLAGGVGIGAIAAGNALANATSELKDSGKPAKKKISKGDSVKEANLGSALSKTRAALYGSGLGAAQSALSFDPNDPNDNIAKALGRGAFFGGVAGVAGNKLLGRGALLGMAAVPAGTAAYQGSSAAYDKYKRYREESERDQYRSDLAESLGMSGGTTESDLDKYISRRKATDSNGFFGGVGDFLGDTASGVGDIFRGAGEGVYNLFASDDTPAPAKPAQSGSSFSLSDLPSFSDLYEKANLPTYPFFAGGTSKPAQSGSSFSLSDLPSFSDLYEKANLPTFSSFAGSTSGAEDSTQQGSNFMRTMADHPYLTAGAGLGAILGGGYLLNRMNSPAERDPRDKLKELRLKNRADQKALRLKNRADQKALRLKNRATSGRSKQAEAAEASPSKYKLVGSLGGSPVPPVPANKYQEALAKRQLADLDSPSVFSQAKSYLGAAGDSAKSYLENDVNRKRLLVGAGAGALLGTGAAGLSGARRARQTLRDAGMAEHEIDRVVTPLGGAARSLGKSTLGAGAGGALGYGLGRGLNALLGEEAKIEGLGNILGGVGALGGLGYGAYSSYQGEQDRADMALAEREYQKLLVQSRRKKKNS